MSDFRAGILQWFDSGRIAPGREFEVLRASGILPDSAQWRAFLGRLTLWLGTIALAAALIFFFAFNWDDLDRFSKFALAEAAILGALLACWRVDLDDLTGKAVLLLLSLLTGALLALAGQVYQTGADTYELFAYWAVLILPWVGVGRFGPLWLLWLGLLNLAAWLYFGLFRDSEALLWALFCLNGLALAGWEAAHRAGLAWLKDDWPPRLVALASGTAATALVVWAIMGGGPGGTAAGAFLAYFVWLSAICVWYRGVRPDAFMLAGGLLSLIVAVVVFLSQNMLGGASGGFLFIALVVIAMSAGGAVWLKSAADEQRA
jgi:uncharacterized membrane protein